MARRTTKSVDFPGGRDGWPLPYQLETLDLLRDLPRRLGLADDHEASRPLRFLADMGEIGIARALHDLAERVAPYHAAGLAARWGITPPAWARDELTAQAARYWRGTALPTRKALRRYREDLDLLRAAADIYDRGRAVDRFNAREIERWEEALRQGRQPRDPISTTEAEWRVDHGPLSTWWAKWAFRLDKKPNSVRRWPAAKLYPVLERLADRELIDEFETYLIGAAKHLEIDLGD